MADSSRRASGHGSASATTTRSSTPLSGGAGGGASATARMARARSAGSSGVATAAADTGGRPVCTARAARSVGPSIAPVPTRIAPRRPPLRRCDLRVRRRAHYGRRARPRRAGPHPVGRRPAWAPSRVGASAIAGPPVASRGAGPRSAPTGPAASRAGTTRTSSSAPASGRRARSSAAGPVGRAAPGGGGALSDSARTPAIASVRRSATPVAGDGGGASGGSALHPVFARRVAAAALTPERVAELREQLLHGSARGRGRVPPCAAPWSRPVSRAVAAKCGAAPGRHDGPWRGGASGPGLCNSAPHGVGAPCGPMCTQRASEGTPRSSRRNTM